MKFIKIGNTRWVNIGTGHVATVTAHAGRSIVKVSTGEAINDDRTPEVLIADLERAAVQDADWSGFELT